ncbi:carbohydrate ABC transporter permease [Roseateles puraquae]|uniref:Sugar ABC transporter permease n=1 Tax=Roseateles puraquae TaxID=431059 RepID=A0A254NAY5_9BURK|nr:sugar ABC transporter permease [Roseateles puraquae]MDG0854095.1 sugar ABC transporter permease [Roseateles puraquae]OWR03557.1 sugar ABC transporter permease [Roseateles puraquae]
MNWRRHGRDIALVTPFFALFGLFGIWPVLRSAWLSLTDYHATDAPRFIGLRNYAELAADERFWTALGNTAAYMASVSTIAVLLGLVLALNFGSNSRLHQAVRVAFFLPSVAGGVGAISAWKWLANSEAYGLFNSLRAAFGLAPARFLGDPGWTLPVLVLVGVWSVLGYNLVIFVTGLRAIPQELYQAARLDGASRWQQLRHITLPNLRPTLVYVSVTGMIASFQVFYEPYLLYGAVDTLGGPLDSALMLVTYLFDRGFRHLDLGLASAAAWVLTLLLFGLTWLNLKLIGQETGR